MIKENPTMNDLFIAPEGTCSNGKALLTFKKGAFKDFEPVKMYAFDYNSYTDKFKPYNDGSCTSALEEIFLIQCNWINKVILYEFAEVFDPTYLNIDKTQEDAWKIYAERVRMIYAKLLGIKRTDYGLR